MNLRTLTLIVTLVLSLNKLLYALPPVEEININSDTESVQKRAKAYLIVADTENELSKALRAMPLRFDQTPQELMQRGLIIRAAIEKYNEALKLFPNFASAHEQLALCYVRLDSTESVESAKRHFGQALRLDPARVNTHLGLINLLLVWKSFDEAEEAAKNLARISPEHGETMIKEVADMRELAKSRER